MRPVTGGASTDLESAAFPVLVAGVTLQAGLGLSRRDWYVDAAWVKSTWLGNDIVTLLVIVPLLLVSFAAARRGLPGAIVVRTGLFGYCAYNYLFYLLGARLNVFFPLYVLLVLVAAHLLVRTLLHVQPAVFAESTVLAGSAFGRATTRAIAAWLMFVGLMLGCVWLAIWGRHVFLDVPTPVSVEAFQLVAALDLTIITPSLVTTGVLLWLHRPWGYFGGAVAAIGGTAYLLVLWVNATLAWSGGSAAARTEAILWGTLTLLTLVSAVGLCGMTARPRRLEVFS